MKTCEEYVLKRLEELEKQNDKLRKEKEELLIKLNDAKNDQKLLIAIGDRIKIKEGDDDLLAKNISNALQEPAIFAVPAIEGIIDELHSFGLNMVQVTGSGSAVFALSTDKVLLKKVLKKLEDKYEVELAKVLK